MKKRKFYVFGVAEKNSKKTRAWVVPKKNRREIFKTLFENINLGEKD